MSSFKNTDFEPANKSQNSVTPCILLKVLISVTLFGQTVFSFDTLAPFGGLLFSGLSFCTGKHTRKGAIRLLVAKFGWVRSRDPLIHYVSIVISAGDQSWIIHCAAVVPWEGPPPPGGPDQLPFYSLTAKKVVTFLGEEKCTPREKILGTRMRKGPPPYVGMGPPNG